MATSTSTIYNENAHAILSPTQSKAAGSGGGLTARKGPALQQRAVLGDVTNFKHAGTKPVADKQKIQSSSKRPDAIIRPTFHVQPSSSSSQPEGDVFPDEIDFIPPYVEVPGYTNPELLQALEELGRPKLCGYCPRFEDEIFTNLPAVLQKDPEEKPSKTLDDFISSLNEESLELEPVTFDDNDFE